MTYKQYTREQAGLRPPARTSIKFPYRGKATIHYSASDLTPIGRLAARKLVKPRQPGAKWYAIWKRPHTTPEEKARRVAVSRVISEYNDALKKYNAALKALGPVDPKVIELEKAIWRGFQAFHMGPSRGWNDIGYHIGIFASGNRYEGRFSSPIAIVQGAHAVNANDTLGVTFVTKGDITEHQELSFAELFRDYGLDGSSFRGHFEVPGNSTSCPGPFIMTKIVRKYRGR